MCQTTASSLSANVATKCVLYWFCLVFEFAFAPRVVATYMHYDMIGVALRLFHVQKELLESHTRLHTYEPALVSYLKPFVRLQVIE